MLDVRKKPDLSTIETDLKALTTAAKSLNSVSDQLTEKVADIEGVINSLNLGLRVTVVVRSHQDQNQPYVTHVVRLGYDKNEGKWGFEIEEFDDDDRDPEDYRNYKSWTFKDAPRSLRLEVIHKIPELIKALCTKTEATTAKVTEKLDDAKAIAFSVSSALDGLGK